MHISNDSTKNIKTPVAENKILKNLKKNKQLLLLFMPCLIFYIIFRYLPIYGLVIAFQDYQPFLGITGSQWVGLKHFQQFFMTPDFLILFKNTLTLGLMSLVIGFPFPIIFALLVNEVRNAHFKKTVQTISYLPSFLSMVILCSMIVDFLSPSKGIINAVIGALGFEKQYFLIKPEWFRTIYISSDIWFTTGFSSIIYMAAISSVDVELYDAGKIDGCGRFNVMWNITLPSILPTVAITFILSAGCIIRVGFEKILLLYNPATMGVADVFSTFVYRQGIIQQNYSYGSAVGLFESVVSVLLLMFANRISKKISDYSLW